MGLFNKIKKNLAERQARKDKERKIKIARLKDEKVVADARAKERRELDKLKKEKFQRSFLGNVVKEAKNLRQDIRSTNRKFSGNKKSKKRFVKQGKIVDDDELEFRSSLADERNDWF